MRAQCLAFFLILIPQYTSAMDAAHGYSMRQATLHGAALSGNIEITKLLLQAGANINETDNIGWTPLHYAASQNRLEIARLLLEHNASISVKSTSGKTALHIAASWGYVRMTKLLLENKASVREPDNDGRTPLHKATQGGYLTVVHLLLQHGADPFAPDKQGITPFDLSQSHTRDLIVEFVAEVLEEGIRTQWAAVRSPLQSIALFPRQRTGCLIFGNAGFKKVFLFCQINRL